MANKHTYSMRDIARSMDDWIPHEPVYASVQTRRQVIVNIVDSPYADEGWSNLEDLFGDHTDWNFVVKRFLDFIVGASCQAMFMRKENLIEKNERFAGIIDQIEKLKNEQFKDPFVWELLNEKVNEPFPKPHYLIDSLTGLGRPLCDWGMHCETKPEAKRDKYIERKLEEYSEGYYHRTPNYRDVLDSLQGALEELGKTQVAFDSPIAERRKKGRTFFWVAMAKWLRVQTGRPNYKTIASFSNAIYGFNGDMVTDETVRKAVNTWKSRIEFGSGYHWEKLTSNN